jgi:hypothetical protein
MNATNDKTSDGYIDHTAACHAQHEETSMKRKPLTTLEAADIGREMGVRGLIIHRDPVDRTLWQVVTPGRCQTHEPMNEKTWRDFIATSGWIDRPVRYDAGNGRKVTVPENDEQDLFDAIHEQLSPHAVAAIVAYLQPVATKDSGVNKQVAWFSDRLIEVLGGHEQQSRLAEELGL